MNVKKKKRKENHPTSTFKTASFCIIFNAAWEKTVDESKFKQEDLQNCLAVGLYYLSDYIRSIALNLRADTLWTKES